MTTWTFGGSALTSFGRVTVIDDYLDTAERRGENIIIPFRHGRTFVQKYYDERRITIGLAINVASATVLESTLDTLKKLLSVRTQQTLAQTREDSSVRNISATVDTPMQVERFNDRFAKAILEFTCTAPYFRSNTLIADNTTTISAGTVAMNVVNTGTVEERDPVITLKGPLNNPVLTNTTNSHSLTYGGSIAGTVTIQTSSTGEYTAVNGTTNVIGNITHSGGAALMVLDPGTNVFSITNSGGTTGSVKVSFYPPYL
jgi:predicted phage tail component-like protein